MKLLHALYCFAVHAVDTTVSQLLI